MKRVSRSVKIGDVIRVQDNRCKMLRHGADVIVYDVTKRGNLPIIRCGDEHALHIVFKWASVLDSLG